MGDDRDVVFGQVCAVLARTFAIGIERRLNITLPREAAYGARTAGDLSAICRETLGQRHQDG